MIIGKIDKEMAQLIKQYPQNQERNRVVFTGSINDMIFHLNATEERLNKSRLSSCGTVFTETCRIDQLTLNTCIYKNIDTDEEESMDINYVVFR